MTASPQAQTQLPLPPHLIPKSYSFPPFYTLQPTTQTRLAQLKKWSHFIRLYCQHHRIQKLNLSPETLSSPLFTNATLKKSLSLKDVRTVIDFMASDPAGDSRAEWIGPTNERSQAWIYYRRPEEWASLIANWVEETGQKGTVLTLYELVQGETTEGQEFYGLDVELLRRSLGTLVKKGKAQVFGQEDQMGVKFF